MPHNSQVGQESAPSKQPSMLSRWLARPARAAAHVGIVAVLVCGVVTFSAGYKSVALDVDGHTQVVHTFAADVGDLLAQQNITISDRDVVVPGVDDAVPAGGDVVVRTAKQLTVTVDGTQQQVWTTAQTLDEALSDLGVRDQEIATSVSRSARVDQLRGEVLVSTAKPITVVVDGSVVSGNTTAQTVGAALADLGVTLSDDDVVSLPLSTPLVDDLVVQVGRHTITDTSETQEMPYASIEEEDSSLLKGTRKVVRQGENGEHMVSYQEVRVDGVVVDRIATAEVVARQPVDELIKVGTKVPVTPKAPSSGSSTSGGSAPAAGVYDPGSAQGIAREKLAARGWGDDQFNCLVALWNRESGWNINSHNRSSGAYGIPQALPGSKMASVGADWQTNPATQIEWGLGYISGRYGTPCSAWSSFQAKGWY